MGHEDLSMATRVRSQLWKLRKFLNNIIKIFILVFDHCPHRSKTERKKNKKKKNSVHRWHAGPHTCGHSTPLCFHFPRHDGHFLRRLDPTTSLFDLIQPPEDLGKKAHSCEKCNSRPTIDEVLNGRATFLDPTCRPRVAAMHHVRSELKILRLMSSGAESLTWAR